MKTERTYFLSAILACLLTLAPFTGHAEEPAGGQSLTTLWRRSGR